ncbi:MAG TPA: hypothetical protein VGA40_09435 [Candidatus Acidoferrales bacterium]
MLQQNGLEYRILHYALSVGGSEGRTATWDELRQGITDESGDCRDDALRQALVDLHSRRWITLQKWDEKNSRFQSFRESQSIYQFFMRGSFRITATSEGCECWAAILYAEEILTEASRIQSQQ